MILAGGDPVGSLAAKTFTGRRLNAYGSLTCSGVSVLAPLRPLANSVGGLPIPIGFESIDCAQPLGGTTVTIMPGNQRLRLVDTGSLGDLVAKDGIATINWSPCSTGTYTLSFPTGQSITTTVTASTPCISLPTRSGPPGARIRVDGTGYGAGEKVQVLFEGALIGRATADASGAFRTTVTIPGGESSGAHEIEAVGVSGLTSVAVFTVT